MLIIGIAAFLSGGILVALCIDIIFDDIKYGNILKIVGLGEIEKYKKLFKEFLEVYNGK